MAAKVCIFYKSISIIKIQNVHSFNLYLSSILNRSDKNKIFSNKLTLLSKEIYFVTFS